MSRADIRSVIPTASDDVLSTLEHAGLDAADVAQDVALLRSGERTRESLLAECTEGADHQESWAAYVSDVAIAAGVSS